jgi:hypothetical protein
MTLSMNLSHQRSAAIFAGVDLPCADKVVE